MKLAVEGTVDSESTERVADKTPPAMRLSTEELILRMGLRGEQAQLAEDAFAEFYRKFSRQLLAAAYKFTYWGADFDPEQTVDEAFHRAFRGASKFNHPKGLPDSTSVDDKVLVWLFRILTNLIRDFIELQRLRQREASKYVRSSCQIVRESIAGIGWRARLFRYQTKFGIIRQWFASRSERDKEILKASFDDSYDERSGCRLRQDVRDELCRKFKMTPESLRQARSRLVKDLRLRMMSQENPPEPNCL